MRAWIVEDDYDSEFRYVSRPLTALQGLDTGRRVVYVGTFSKVMFPALRIGFVIAPPSLLPAIAAARQFAERNRPRSSRWSSPTSSPMGTSSDTCAACGRCTPSASRTLIDALRAECAELVDAAPAGSGMHLVGWLPPRRG